MPVPTAATVATICTEALKRAGVRSPSSNQIARAKAEWFEEIKADIWQRANADGNTRLKSLESTGILVLQPGQRRYQLPADFDEEFSVTLLEPDITFVVEASSTYPSEAPYVSCGSADAGFADLTEAKTEGKYICCVEQLAANIAASKATPVAQFREVHTYTDTSATVKTLSVDTQWDGVSTTQALNNLPLEGDTVVILNNHYDLDEYGIREGDRDIYRAGTGRPSAFFKHRKELFLDTAPDQDYYVLRLRYYADITRLDDAAATHDNMVREWRSVLVRGVQALAAQDLGDLDLYRLVKPDYEMAVKNLLLREMTTGGQDLTLTAGESWLTG